MMHKSKITRQLTNERGHSHTADSQPDAERHRDALTQTDAPHALARDNFPATKQNKDRGPPSRLELDGHAKKPVHRGSCGQVGRVGTIGVACGRGGARLAKGVQGKGGAHLLVDDADQVLDAISFQGVS